MLLLKENAETQKIPVGCAPKPKHREPDPLTVEVKSSCISFDLLFLCLGAFHQGLHIFLLSQLCLFAV